ncbi:MAG TPA: hypothetical protein VFP72_22630 [Kineosporiaceae bacterium]|nr:hypothetical protein [Kineosporiaceae bacterium]
MTDTNPSVGTQMPAQSPRRTEPTGWVGWIVFGAVMMIIIGGLHVIQGLVALLKDTYYLVTNSGLVVAVNYTGWGWVHVIFGVIVCAAGIVLFTGRMWARIVAVCVAALSLLINFTFIAAYPFWSLTLMALDIIVMYAVIVHGREMREARTL